jgi:hypothetical protein
LAAVRAKGGSSLELGASFALQAATMAAAPQIALDEPGSMAVVHGTTGPDHARIRQAIQK